MPTSLIQPQSLIISHYLPEMQLMTVGSRREELLLWLLNITVLLAAPCILNVRSSDTHALANAAEGAWSPKTTLAWPFNTVYMARRSILQTCRSQHSRKRRAAILVRLGNFDVTLIRSGLPVFSIVIVSIRVWTPLEFLLVRNSHATHGHSTQMSRGGGAQAAQQAMPHPT